MTTMALNCKWMSCYLHPESPRLMKLWAKNGCIGPQKGYVHVHFCRLHEDDQAWLIGLFFRSEVEGDSFRSSSREQRRLANGLRLKEAAP